MPGWMSISLGAVVDVLVVVVVVVVVVAVVVVGVVVVKVVIVGVVVEVVVAAVFLPLDAETSSSRAGYLQFELGLLH
jgi:hypothetical protein